MKVMVLKSFRNLGPIGSIISVKPGYAKNYLVPNGVASYATKSVLAEYEKKMKDLVNIDSAERNEAVAVEASFAGSFIRIVRSASDDGRLYGSVSPRDVLAALSSCVAKEGKVLKVKRGDIFFAPIKEIGFYDCRINLHSDVFLNIKINICRSESEGLLAEKKLLAKDSEEARSEKKTQGKSVPRPVGGPDANALESAAVEADMPENNDAAPGA